MRTPKLISTLCGIGISLSAFAVPANPEPYPYVQPDGSVIMLVNHGDEFAHATTTEDGRLVTFSDDGTAIVGEQPADLAKTLRSQRQKNNRFAQRAKVGNNSDILQPDNIEGNIHGLIILVNFADLKFKNTQEYVQRQMNEEGFSENGATGSARDYFMRQSSGKYTPTFDVIGPVDLDQDMSYYGRDLGIYGSGNDAHPDEMVFVAVDNAVKEGLLENLDAYDRDNDGMVDMVYVIFAGQGQADGGSAYTIWPHMYSIEYSYRFRNAEIAGKRLGTYACSAEYRRGNVFSGIGTFCHEYGHCLGLPDMYDVDYSGGYGMANYSIMGSGSYNNNGNTPPNYNSFERYSLGWLNYEELTTPQSVSLGEIGATNKAYILKTNDPNEFFSIENRQYVDWDRYLPSRGLMILHIDYDKEAWDENSVNDDRSHQRVVIVPADNTLSTANASLTGDLYPGTTGNTSFTDTSKPAAKTWNGDLLGKPVTNIAVDFDTELATFDFDKEEDHGAVSLIESNGVKASVSGAILTVTLPEAGKIEVYATSGIQVGAIDGMTGANTLQLPGKGLYIVKAGTTTLKVIR